MNCGEYANIFRAVAMHYLSILFPAWLRDVRDACMYMVYTLGSFFSHSVVEGFSMHETEWLENYSVRARGYEFEKCPISWQTMQ